MAQKPTQLSFYGFFTKYSLMEDYGFSAGLLQRLGRKLLPQLPEAGTFDYWLAQAERPVDEALAYLPLGELHSTPIAAELDASIKALGAKVVAFGLDKEMKARFDRLQLDQRPFTTLMARLNNCEETQGATEMLSALKSCQAVIIALRKGKGKIGTSLHLTVTTRNILEYIGQLRQLLELKENLNSESHWRALLNDHLAHARAKNSIGKYVSRHVDLLALEVVEHTSTKGGKYVAESRSEYWGFFKKSLLGGGIIALFALAKICFNYFEAGPVQNALLFSLNYAACFVFVKQVGGIIATKQPAVTASTIAKGIDGANDLQLDSIDSVIVLVRRVIRTQVVSILGNFLMALTFASLLALALNFFGVTAITELIDPEYLVKNTKPSFRLVAYAAIAGVFLALAGLISGYFDNKVVASKIAFRIRNGRGLISGPRLASFVENKAGALIGNVSLGFFLGSVFLLGRLLPFAVDIRHIAFSSANVGYAAMNAKLGWSVIGLTVCGALLIGLVNFIVSFSITLLLALKSRGVSLRTLPTILARLAQDFFRSPAAYFFYREEVVSE